MSRQKAPNIILIYTDQQRYDTLGVNGNTLIKTPNLDKLADRGVLFSRSYVTQPICVPSRTALFTGRYNHTNLSYNNERLMFDRESDFVSLLKNNGYWTGIAGKNHCFKKERLKDTFDYIRLASHCGFNQVENDNQKQINEYRSQGAMQAPVFDDPFPAENNITATVFKWAKKFIKEGNDNPFFLWLSIPDPHPPYMVSEPYDSMYDNIKIPLPEWSENEMVNKPYRQQLIQKWNRFSKDYPSREDIEKYIKTYWGMVSNIDYEIGELIYYLEKQGLFKDTIIVFTSDHGDYLGDHKMSRKGPHLYESLVHVPLIISWGSNIKNQKTDAFVCNIDIFPTLCDLVGIDILWDVQGESFADLLLGKKENHRDMVFMEHGNPGQVIQKDNLNQEEKETITKIEKEIKKLNNLKRYHLCPLIFQGRSKAVRTDRWKYVYTPGEIDELYDLKEDPAELNNLAGDQMYNDVINKLKEYILDWLIETEDTF